MAALLTVDRVDKHYGPIHAVSGVSLAFDAGRVHAVVGENGAGKSTLLKVAAGLVVPDHGEVRIGEARLQPHTAREAIRRGVGMVQQHFSLVGALTALENLMLGAEPVHAFGRLDMGAARMRAVAVAREIGVSLPWDAPVETLGVGDRQRIEIVRTLAREARVVILDEPTAVLSPVEAVTLYATLRRMAEAGRAIIVVTHRLDEVRDHADVASVLRRGKLVSTREVARGEDVGLQAIVHDAMGDGPVPEIESRRREPPGETLLEVRDVRLGTALLGATLRVRSGEIVGVAGVDGNGQRELVRVLAGLDAPESGDWRAQDVTVVHEDRRSEGLVLDATVRDNLLLGELARFTRFGFVDSSMLEVEAGARLERARIAPADLDGSTRSLSGGNQQKIVVVRAVSRADRTSVFVFAQPTRGLDVGAARAVHREIVRAADSGKAILLVSADLAELRTLCDRILVMTRGRIVAELPPDASDERIGEAMLGGAEGGPP